jgi:hypothetical protein
MAITPLPPAPEPGDTPQQFNSKAFAFVDALDTFVTEANAQATTVNTNATTATTKAAEAAASADAASQTANVVQWVTGTSYAAGANVFSPIDFQTYRAKSAFTSNTDPSADLANWTRLTNSGVFAAGAVGTPSITTTNDQNTGIYFPAPDTMAVAVGGVEALKVESGKVTVNGQLLAVQTPSISAVSWDSSADDYFFVAGYPSGPTNIHQNMRRCVINDSGVVQYYLDSLDSTKTISGGTAALDGSVGQVMVEIPKFWVKKTKVSNLNTWWIADAPLPGFSVHPAFIKNGVEVNYRYYGAYDACVNTTGSTYQSGLNWDNNIGSGNGQAWNIATAKLASVSGVFPAVGLKRSDARSMAANRGTGWRQLDFYLLSAVQLLYLIEYGTFNSQFTLGAGNTNVTNAYNVGSSGNQTDSPHSEAGKSNALGNRSTNITSGAESATRNTAYMAYRGIENWYGNCWNWVDGMNIGESGNYKVWVNNNDTQFADNTSTNYTEIGTALSTNNTFVTNILDISTAFIPSAGGGSSTTGLCDAYFVATGQRVALFGGDAADAAVAGGFSWILSYDSSILIRVVGARLAF